MKAGLVGLVLLLWAGTAAAAEDPVYALYARGDYEGTVRAGEAAHTAAGYAMAARALLGQEMLGDSPCLDCLKRAEQFARRAVAADPRFAWGQLWLAVSLGYEARITGIVRARLDDVPGQAHRALEARLGLEVYFADPRSPWQRGSCENTNGLLREYLPKGSDLTRHSQDDLNAIALRLNTRPRVRLKGVTPLECFTQMIEFDRLNQPKPQ